MDEGDGTRSEAAYRTVDGIGRSAFEIRGSTFRGAVQPATDREDARDVIETVRDENPEATHVVHALRVRENGARSAETGLLRESTNDDGEPSGTAGSPALTVLQRRELENVIATVVRRYGGTNLGVGGLARAYARAVSDAVDSAGTKIERPKRTISLVVEYDDSGTVRSVLESADVPFEASYEATVSFSVSVARDDADELLETLRSATSGRIQIAN
jgi:uncharacterized YigZ family protein